MPLYATREGRMDGLYSVMIVNQALKGYKFKSKFPWCLHIDITMKDMNSGKLPTGKEANVLNTLEDRIASDLSTVCRKLYIGRTTWNEHREIFFYLDSPHKAHKVLQTFTSVKSPLRQFQYEISMDKNWSKVNFFFD